MSALRDVTPSNMVSGAEYPLRKKMKKNHYCNIKKRNMHNDIEITNAPFQNKQTDHVPTAV